MADTLLEARDLTKYFPARAGLVLRRVHHWIRAVDGVTFSIAAGETLGLVGESGCGKTTTAKLILAQESATSGVIRFRDRDITALQKRDLMDYRKSVQVVFQDPYSSLSPRMRVLGLVPRLQPWRLCLAPRGTGRVPKLAAGQIAATRLTHGTYIAATVYGNCWALSPSTELSAGGRQNATT